MDKYEYKLKLDELTELFQLQNYKAAADIADEVNWQKVRNAKTLCMVADVYEAVERYAACQDVLMQAYDHSSVGRNIVGRLCDIAIKSKDVAAAEEFYNEFLELAPKDTQRYVFAYKIACLKNAPVSDRIAILEEFKEKEYSEMWAYELAVLYAQAGMREKCVEACDELILWFGDGEYVERALDLKRSFQPLTQVQEEKYQKFRTEKGMVEINIPQKTVTTPAAPEAKAGLTTEEIKVTKFNTQNLQDEIAKSMEQIESATEENTVRDQLNSIKKIVQDIPYLEGEEEVSISNQEKIQKEVDKGLRTDFEEKLVEETAYGQTASPEGETGVPEDTSGMSIEDILDDWEKTKIVAQEAMAAAEQKKLDLEKERALSEASAIMKRLEELVPILTATPGEDLPDTSEGTVADELLSAEPIILTVPSSEEEETGAEKGGTLPEEQAVTRPLMSRGGHKERNPQDKMADVESLEDWSEEDDKALEQVLAEEMLSDDETGAAAEEAEESYDEGELLGREIEAAREEKAAEDIEELAAEAQADADRIDAEAAEDAEELAAEAQADADRIDAEAAEDAEELAAEAQADADRIDAEAAEDAEELAAEAQADADRIDAEAAEDAEQLAEDTAADTEPTEKLEEEKAEEQEEGMLKFGTKEVDDAGLSDEIKEMFSYFIPIPGMAEQISNVLTNTVKTRTDAVNSAEGNLIVQGEEGSGKTILATDLIKATQKTMGSEDEKIGKISADALNTKNFASLVPKIAGGFLIIEKAGNLNPETVATMSAVMEQDTGGMTILLEDDSEGIQKVMSLDPGFAAKFSEKVTIPIFTIDELVDFGKAYAIEQECEIEEMAVLALYNRINNIQRPEHPTTLTEVKEIIDQAIENAEGGGIKKIFAKKYNDEDYLILHEEDFEQTPS